MNSSKMSFSPKIYHNLFKSGKTQLQLAVSAAMTSLDLPERLSTRDELTKARSYTLFAIMLRDYRCLNI